MLQSPKKLLPHLSKNHVSRLLYQSLLVSAIEEDNFLLNTKFRSRRQLPVKKGVIVCSGIWLFPVNAEADDPPRIYAYAAAVDES